MGRHSTASSKRRMPLLLGVATSLVVAALVVVVGLPVLRGGNQADAAGTCVPTSTVRLLVTGDVADPVDSVTSEPIGYGGGCTRAVYRIVEPAQAAASLASLDTEDLPDLWIPDSSVWLTRAGSTPVRATSAFASSPVVLATSREAAEQLGWIAAAPSWGSALTAGRPLAVPDLSVSAEGILGLAAVRTSLGATEAADRVVVQAALAADAGEVPSAAEAMAAAAQGGAAAPLVPMSERDVLLTNRSRDSSRLLAVYPSDGSPTLNYPVVRVGTPSAEQAAAVDAVVERLTSPAAQEAARRAGFRDPAGTAPTGAGSPTSAGSPTGVQEPAPQTMALDPLAVRDMADRLVSLKTPSRLLTVIDVSTSMRASAGEGRTRIELARDAARGALAALPDRASIGVWAFASELDGTTDYVELSASRPLDAQVDGGTQRERLHGVLDTLPDRLSPGGTSLYDTVLAAVRNTRASYDSERVNTVVLITDGRNEDSAGIQLEQLLQTLEAERSEYFPVQVVAVGLGPDADNEALAAIAGATGGMAYQADDPNDLQTVLFEALRRRSA